MSISVYCDASVINKKQLAVLGMVIKSNNKVIHKNQRIVEKVSGGSTHGELLAAEMTMDVLEEMNITKVTVFMDSQGVVHRMRNEDKLGMKHGKRIKRIKRKAQELGVEFHWIPRNKNKTADKLTKTLN